MRSVTVVVPARNEARRLPRLFATLSNGGRQALRDAGLELTEVVVVDDGSTDGTAELVREHADGAIRLLGEPARGKGAAVRAGVLAARAPWVLVIDADLATPLDQAAQLVRAVENGADIAIGSRGLAESAILVHQPRHRELAGKTFNLLVRLLTGLRYRDTQCGFKLFRASSSRVLFEEQRVDGFAFDVEILVAARRHGLRVDEVPVRWIDDARTSVRFARASKEMLFDLFRITVRDVRHRPGVGRRKAGWDITQQGGRAE